MFKGNITAMLIAFFTVLGCGATKYQIKYLNTPTININQRELKTGDWFNDDAVINWEKDSQAMRVLGEDNKVYTLSAKRYKESRSKKFSDFIALTKPMASRGLQTLRNDLMQVFENEYEILDELQLDLTDIEELPDGITILLSARNSEETVSLKPENGIVTLYRETIPTPSASEETIPFTVQFRLPDSDESHLITTWFELTLLPI